MIELVVVVVDVMHWSVLVVVRSGGEGVLIRVDGLGIARHARRAGEVAFSLVVEDGIE